MVEQYQANGAPRQKKELVSRLERLTNSKLQSTQRRAAANPPYGVGDGEGEASVFLVSFLVVSFLVVSFLVVSAFFVVSVVDFLVVDFFVVEVLAGGVVVVAVSVLLVLQEARSPAASMTVME
jgi:hypothetical protein